MEMPMNYYHCYGYSEIRGRQHEVDILIKHEDMNQARMVASWYINNISYLGQYPIKVTEFGNPIFIINHEGKDIEIVSSSITIKEAFKLLCDIGMEIKSINSTTHPLKPNIAKIMRGMLRKEYGISNDDPFTLTVEDDEPLIDSELTPTQLIKITELMTNILKDAKELYVRTKGVLSGDNFILFTRSIEQLQQTLLQGDIFIAKEQTKKLISYMEQIEGEFMEYERARDHQLQNQITIPNLNTILAHNQWMSAHKMYELQSTENSQVEQWYQTLYHKFLQKHIIYITGIINDIKSTVGPHNSIISYFIRKFEYALIFMSCMIVLIIENHGHTQYRGTTLYVIGLLGFALQCTHLFHTKKWYIKLAYLGMTTTIIGCIGYVIASNLALI